MKSEYDFSGARKNPYAKRLTQRVTIRLDEPSALEGRVDFRPLPGPRPYGLPRG